MTHRKKILKSQKKFNLIIIKSVVTITNFRETQGIDEHVICTHTYTHRQIQWAKPRCGNSTGQMINFSKKIQRKEEKENESERARKRNKE